MLLCQLHPAEFLVVLIYVKWLCLGPSVFIAAALAVLLAHNAYVIRGNIARGVHYCAVNAVRAVKSECQSSPI